MNHKHSLLTEYQFISRDTRLLLGGIVNFVSLPLLIMHLSYFMHHSVPVYSYIVLFVIFQAVLFTFMSYFIRFRFLLAYSALFTLTVLFLIFIFIERDRPEFISFMILYPAFAFFLGRIRYGVILSIAGFMGMTSVHYVYSSFLNNSNQNPLFIFTSYIFISIISILYEKRDRDRQNGSKLGEADLDFLTQVPNRRGIFKLVGPLLKKGELSLIVIDVDDFKKINESHGHEGGDRLLKQMASLFQNTIRKTDLFSRWGGEEFILILPDTKKENAVFLAEKLRRLLEKTDFDGMRVTASFGISSYIRNEEFEELFRRADKGAYIAKEKGKNRVEMM